VWDGGGKGVTHVSESDTLSRSCDPCITADAGMRHHEHVDRRKPR